MSFSFGSLDFAKCLKCLGFSSYRQVGSSHLKYKLPSNIKMTTGRDFIILIQGKKSYDPHTCSKIINQLVKLGIKEDEIMKCFKRKSR